VAQPTERPRAGGSASSAKTPGGASEIGGRSRAGAPWAAVLAPVGATSPAPCLGAGQLGASRVRRPVGRLAATPGLRRPYQGLRSGAGSLDGHAA
jgi:hypothetical protein